MGRKKTYYIELIGRGFYAGDTPDGRPLFKDRLNQDSPSFNNESQGYKKVDEWEQLRFTEVGSVYRVFSAEVIDDLAPPVQEEEGPGNQGNNPNN